MIPISYRANGSTSNIERVFLYKDSGATAGTEGDPFTGLAFNTASLSIATIANNEATANVDTTAATSSVETIATLGTYATPTAGFVRFKEVDATNMPGLYELQWENARYAVAGAKYLDICITGVADLATFTGRVYLDVMDAAGIRTALGLATANLDTQLSTIDTVVDGIAANYATAASVTAVNDLLDDMVDGTVTLKTIDDVVDLLLVDTTAIVADTNELQADWANGGRLDLLLDAIKVPTDKMVFTKANELDVNTKSINGATVVGDGNATPWDGV